MAKVGDEVILKKPLWHNAEDVGDRLGRVISTEGHIIVELYDYDDNPVKCFRNDVEVVPEDYASSSIELNDEELMNLLNNLFP